MNEPSLSDAARTWLETSAEKTDGRSLLQTLQGVASLHEMCGTLFVHEWSRLKNDPGKICWLAPWSDTFFDVEARRREILQERDDEIVHPMEMQQRIRNRVMNDSIRRAVDQFSEGEREE